LQLKCDEAAPACTNCIRRGWQCPGYGKNIRWSAKHERFGPLSHVSPASQSDGVPVRQAPQQPLYHDWHSPGSDGLWTLYGSRSDNPGTHVTHYPVTSSSQYFPLTRVSQCATDDNVVDARNSPADLAVKAIDDANDPHAISEMYESVDTQEALHTSYALPDHINTLTHSSSQESLFDPRIFYTPTHIPTILIEHWFSDVCPMWNIFDSDYNFNRQFASTSWSSSEPVFYAMQSMSAACLVDTLPAMMPVLSSLTMKALDAIRSRVSFYQTSQQTAVPTFPTDLLFAIFAMGTSLHWKHGFELGTTLMKHAHYVIDRYRKRLPAMTPSERKHLAFFQKALICWEGILSAADSNFTPTSFAVRRSAYQARMASGHFQNVSPQPTFGPRPLSPGDAELHPWCGASSDVLQKFGQVMTLCHIAQRRLSNAAKDGKLEANCDLGLACELASELLAMDFGSDSCQGGTDDQYLGTNDIDTPLSHLLDIAEAYRQACLLQLSLTFDDLPMTQSAYPTKGLLAPVHGSCIDTYAPSRAKGLVGLSLQLVNQLKKIPPESGSRCMQPLLYLCAASGLQLNPLPPVVTVPTHGRFSAQDYLGLDNSATLREPLGYTAHGDYLGDHLLPACSGIAQDFNADHAITISTFKVAQARSFVKKRLGMLQQLLPPRYTGTALRLIEAIWTEYDCTSGDGSPLYWFDVMVREKLQTFFG
jgi:hypothetical protein